MVEKDIFNGFQSIFNLLLNILNGSKSIKNGSKSIKNVLKSIIFYSKLEEFNQKWIKIHRIFTSSFIQNPILLSDSKRTDFDDSICKPLSPKLTINIEDRTLDFGNLAPKSMAPNQPTKF